ncbi:hypothetical protein VN97_g9773 [Penicillium thymicola]|uniref:Uncharacterized protein n=1 Tax=Penicillium thymicola TaxID=293382 RepID=A0AAI9TAW0_PENTH|nr:hypothetical protein VN97_g9773 [Penicillium thymicola]
MATAALHWLFTSSLSRSGILFLSVSALTKVPAFVFLLHHIPLFALICAYIAGRFVYYAIVIHTRHSDTPQVASSFIFAIYNGYYLVHRPCPVICLRQTRKLTIRLCFFFFFAFSYLLSLFSYVCLVLWWHNIICPRVCWYLYIYILKRGTLKAVCSEAYGSIQHSQFSLIPNLAYKGTWARCPRSQFGEL